MLQRRAVLAALGGAMASSLVPFGAHAGPKLTTCQQYAELISSRFRLTDEDGNRCSARLVAVDNGPSYPGLEQFSMVFEGDDLTDGLHKIWSLDTGELLVTTMPSGAPGSGPVRKRVFISKFA
jgi:hypothetical protein